MEPAEAIQKLLTEGRSEHSIASAVGVNQSTINRIRNGKMQPTYALGKGLVDLANAKSQPPAAQAGAGPSKKQEAA